MRIQRIHLAGARVHGAPMWRPCGSVAAFDAVDSEDYGGSYQEHTAVVVGPSVAQEQRGTCLVARNGVLESWFEGRGPGTHTDLVPATGYNAARRQNLRVLWQPANGQEDTNAESGLLYCAQVGDRVRLTWDRCDEDDFSEYRIYWDEGAGGAVDTLMETVDMRDEVEYYTEALTAGTYQFCLALVDQVGNEGTPGAAVSVTIAAIPDAPTVAGHEAAADYGFDGSAINVDVVVDAGCELAVYSNWLAGHSGLLERAQTLHTYPIIDSGGGVYASQALWAGVWEFRFYSVSSAGVHSEATEVRFELIDNAGTLEMVDDVEDAPVLEASPQAAAVIYLNWFETPMDYDVEIEVSEDDGDTWSAAETLTAGETNTTYAGVDDTEYVFRARFVSEDGASGPWSETAEATADGTGPDGDTDLTAEIV